MLHRLIKEQASGTPAGSRTADRPPARPGGCAAGGGGLDYQRGEFDYQRGEFGNARYGDASLNV